MSELLFLAEKRQLAAAWDALSKLISAGCCQATPEQQKAVNEEQLLAHRRVAATVFLSLPRADGVAQCPKLADSYRLLGNLDRQAHAQGHTRLSPCELERSQHRIAAAIETGEALHIKNGTLEVLPLRAAGLWQLPREPSRAAATKHPSEAVELLWESVLQDEASDCDPSRDRRLGSSC